MRTIIALLLGTLVVSTAAAQPEDDLAERERTRIRQHLAHVELTLRARDTSHLTPAQRQARLASLDRLRTYRERGVFPRNTRHPDQYLPYFIDDHGTACAVAQLILDSGAEELAHRVADRENHAYVPDMTTEGLGEWADAHGFTVDELAMIQPSYCGPAFDAGPCEGDDDGEDGCSVSAPGAGDAGLPLVLAALALTLGLVRRRRR